MSGETGRLAERRVVLGVCGGIAAYKAAALTSKLVQAGAEVRVLMTRSAKRFVGPLTFESLSGRAVATSQWEGREDRSSEHVAAARWAELVVIAPATANTIAKIAGGFAEDAVTTTVLALPRETPVLFVPAMNAEMWGSPITQKNVGVLEGDLGWKRVGPDEGWQACRTEGAGRMSEPDEIFEAACGALGQ